VGTGTPPVAEKTNQDQLQQAEQHALY